MRKRFVFWTVMLSIVCLRLSLYAELDIASIKQEQDEDSNSRRVNQPSEQSFDDWEQLRVYGLGFLYSVAYSPDGSRLALSGRAGMIEIRDTKTWQIQLQITTVFFPRSIAWSPDGTKLLSGYERRMIRIWDSRTGDLLMTITAHDHAVNSVGWSPDGTKFASGSTDRTIKIWNAVTGDLIRTITEKDIVPSVSWSPDSVHLASSSDDGTVKIWNSDTGELVRTLSGNIAAVIWVSWSPDGTKLASAGYRTAIIWDAKTGELLRRLEHDVPNPTVWTIVWSPDSRLVGTAVHHNDPTIYIWEADSGKQVRTISLPRGSFADLFAYRLSWSPDGRQFVSVSSEYKLRIWDSETGNLIATPFLWAGRVDSVQWSPDHNRLLAAPGFDYNLGEGYIKIWNVDTDEVVQTLTGTARHINYIDWSSTGQIAGVANPTINIWDVKTAELVVTIENENGASLSNVRFSPDGSKLASRVGYREEGADVWAIRIWDSRTGELIRSIPTNASGSVRWSPDGERLAWIGSRSRQAAATQIEIYEVKTGKLIRIIPAGENTRLISLDWSSDGRRIGCGVNVGLRDSGIRLWEAETGELIRTLTAERLGEVRSVVWSPDSRFVASGSGGVRIWDPEEGNLLKTLSGHDSAQYIEGLDWSPDGSRIASGSWDETIRIWGSRQDTPSNDPLPNQSRLDLEPLGFKNVKQQIGPSSLNKTQAHPVIVDKPGEPALARRSWLRSFLSFITFKSLRRY